MFYPATLPISYCTQNKKILHRISGFDAAYDTRRKAAPEGPYDATQEVGARGFFYPGYLDQMRSMNFRKRLFLSLLSK
jgi:hypothetical protein